MHVYPGTILQMRSYLMIYEYTHISAIPIGVPLGSTTHVLMVTRSHRRLMHVQVSNAHGCKSLWQDRYLGSVFREARANERDACSLAITPNIRHANTRLTRWA